MEGLGEEAGRGAGALLELEDIERARARIEGRVHVTPTMSSTTVGDELGVHLHLKVELFQKTGSFKPRGVFNKLLSMHPTDLSRGLVSLSAGNHAAALAYGAAAVGAKATIVMPLTAMPSKVEATRRYGGEVVQTEGSLFDACLALQRERNLTLVHPFDDLAIMAGQGTVGLEILQQVPTVDLVAVPVGGGGLISGIAAAVKLQHPSARVVGVEPAGADAMSRSLERGAPVHLDKVETIADGLAPPFVGEHTFRHARRFVDEMVRVTDAEILDALRMLIQRTKLVTEPSGGAGLAALLAGKVAPKAGSTVVCVISGGNIGLDLLRQLL
ncbi:MAG TPA: threonine/serine dehydratase [Actinomycetota bacterium]|nr:threonine/serine dehydratase [Actinomycetota bacterium]